MKQYMLNHISPFLVLVEGAAGAGLIWFVHSLSLWFLFDTAALTNNIMELLRFIEMFVKIGSTVFITYWTYKGIISTAKKKE